MKSFFLLSCVGLLAGCGEKLAPEIQDVPPLTFTATQASNALLHVISFVGECIPRDGGTADSEKAAIWLHKRLSEQGIDVVIDRFMDDSPQGSRPFANVLATIPGDRNEWIVLLSHFDTMRGIDKEFQGANDGGSSTGLLLELATVLQAAPQKKYNILCAFLDGEECTFAYSNRDGFHGSRHLARQLKAKNTQIKAVILMDMIGDRDLKITVPKNCSASLRVLALEAAEKTGDRDKIGLFDGIIYDDHQAFLDLGYPAVNLIDFYYGDGPGENNYWHTTKDSIDKLSADSLLTTGRLVMEMLNRL